MPIDRRLLLLRFPNGASWRGEAPEGSSPKGPRRDRRQAVCGNPHARFERRSWLRPPRQRGQGV